MRPSVVLALVRRDLLLERSYLFAFLFDLFYGALSFSIYYFVSRALGQARTPLNGASSYFGFVAVGIAINALIYGTSVGLARRIRNEQLTGTLEGLIAQPLSAPELAVGLAGFPVAFAVLRAALYLLIADLWLGLGLHNPNWAAFAGILVAGAAMIAAVGILMAALVIVVKRAEPAAALLTLGFGFFGGALFPLAVLPHWAHEISRFVPTRFAFDGARNALFHGAGAEGDILKLAAIAVVATPVAVVAFGWAVRHTLRRGTLASY